MIRTNFKLDDTVRWTSHSSRGETTKEGRIVRVLTSVDWPQRIAKQEFPYHEKMFKGVNLPANLGDRAYLVEVMPEPGKLFRKKLYMPSPSRLELVNENED